MLALGLAGGLLLAFVTPPFEVPDEPAHFFHVYQLATAAAAQPGPDGASGFWLPASLPRLVELSGVAEVAGHPERRLPPGLLAAAWRLPLAPERRVLVPAGLLSPHAPVAYLPAAAAVAAGRLLALGPLPLLYLARLGNLAAALAVSWAAVRFAPAQRWLLALLALTPMAMFERSSAAADALTNALALLLVSCLLSLALRRSPPGGGPAAEPDGGGPALLRGGGLADRAVGGLAEQSHSELGELDGSEGAAGAMAGALGHGGGPAWSAATARQAAWLLACAFALAAAKGAYFLLDLLIFVVPPSVLGSARRTAELRAGGAAAAAAGAGLSWWVARGYAAHAPLRPGQQPMLQLRRALGEPLRFAGLAAADYLHHGLRYAAGFAGNFGWLDTPLPRPAIAIWGLLLLAAALTGGDAGLALAAWQRWVAAAVVAATMLLLSLSQYVLWTRLGADFVDGLQGRYFLPLAPAAALLFYNRRLAGAGAAGAFVPEPALARTLRAAAPRLLGGLSAAFVVLTLLRIWFRYHGN